MFLWTGGWKIMGREVGSDKVIVLRYEYTEDMAQASLATFQKDDRFTDVTLVFSC